MFTSNRVPALLVAALMACPITAKTDLEGCTSTQTVAYGGASLIWYVPDTGEICAPLDCGGGRAPPKTTVPGCAAYSGTATYSPSYLAGIAKQTVTQTKASSSAEATAEGHHDITSTIASITDSASSELLVEPTATPRASIVDSTMVLNGTAHDGNGTAAMTVPSTLKTSAAGATKVGSDSGAEASSTSLSQASVGAMATAGPIGMLLAVAAGAAML